MSEAHPIAGLHRELQTLRAKVRELERARSEHEEALHESEKRCRELAISEGLFRDLFHTTPAMIHSIDPEGCIVNVSDYWLQVMGFDRDEVLGRRSTDFLTEESRRFALEVVLPNFFATGFCKDVPYRFRKKDGEVIDVLLSATCVRDDDGKVERSLAVSIDVSEQKRAERAKEKLEDQLRQSQKMEALGRLAGGVAHDFNNLLTAILGHVEMLMDALRDKLPAEDPLLHGLQYIDETIDVASNLTRQLLAFSRRQVPQPKDVDLNETLGRLEPMLRHLVSEVVRLDIVTAPQPAAVYADSGQIEQVVMNLVINASDAMPEGGALTLETANVHVDAEHAASHAGARTGPHALLSVRDTGCGIDPENLEKIFEPFFTTKAGEEGTGLGLATVYGIVTQAGGHIGVTSEPGEGTTFEIYLPATKASARAPAREPAGMDAGGGEGR